ncbi:hypothetical protein H0H81_010762 [Sphagnurus paluster]|uniref:Uncharacterized protein n=1 Tax=Sphagnurus paluster TaxID=117069 RepID=A0A9P7GPX1_9AGAR|nr:hypothetical protein H0H81_010762 [Sphagnurus paluster]
MANLNGTEIDFSSADADCLAWFEANPLSESCDWQEYKDLIYNSCVGSVDLLDAGRGQMRQSFQSSVQSIDLSQFGCSVGTNFLGPIRGVLPTGPAGVPAFDSLASQFKNTKILAGVTSYNYTLNFQSLTSNINCSYVPESPITLGAVTADHVEYSANCSKIGEVEVLMGKTQITSTNSDNLLAYWACQSASSSQTQSYSIYLCEAQYDKSGNGNITCTVSLQSAIFPVTYQYTADIFESAHGSEPLITSSSTAFSDLVSRALVDLGNLISAAQNFQTNLVAESVAIFGGKFFDPSNQTYPELYELMIQGILEYEATHLRLMYSLKSPPRSCMQAVTGSASFEVLVRDACRCLVVVADDNDQPGCFGRPHSRYENGKSQRP